MTDTFLDRPIEGDVQHYTGEKPKQEDPQALLDALDSLLDTPGVEAVRWEQYTPYFNDGEACEFGVRDASVKIIGDAGHEPDTMYDDELEEFRDRYDLWEYTSNERDNFSKKYIEIPGVDIEAISDALLVFTNVLNSGRHDLVLHKKFGDPAQVTATKAGFNVEYYDHE